MTKEEKHLWYDYLNKYPVRFRRQEVIGNYIADFYCDKAKLIVEIDGSQHFDDAAIEYDNKRTKYFNSLGLRVLRFTNHEIHTKPPLEVIPLSGEMSRSDKRVAVLAKERWHGVFAVTVGWVR